MAVLKPLPIAYEVIISHVILGMFVVAVPIALRRFLRRLVMIVGAMGMCGLVGSASGRPCRARVLPGPSGPMAQARPAISLAADSEI
jgi:hypothetical protein